MSEKDDKVPDELKGGGPNPPKKVIIIKGFFALSKTIGEIFVPSNLIFVYEKGNLKHEKDVRKAITRVMKNMDSKSEFRQVALIPFEFEVLSDVVPTKVTSASKYYNTSNATVPLKDEFLNKAMKKEVRTELDEVFDKLSVSRDYKDIMGYDSMGEQDDEEPDDGEQDDDDDDDDDAPAARTVKNAVKKPAAKKKK